MSQQKQQQQQQHSGIILRARSSEVISAGDAVVTATGRSWELENMSEAELQQTCQQSQI